MAGRPEISNGNDDFKFGFATIALGIVVSAAATGIDRMLSVAREFFPKNLGAVILHDSIQQEVAIQHGSLQSDTHVNEA